MATEGVLLKARKGFLVSALAGQILTVIAPTWAFSLLTAEPNICMKINMRFAKSAFTTRRHKPSLNGWGRSLPLAQPITVYIMYVNYNYV